MTLANHDAAVLQDCGQRISRVALLISQARRHIAAGEQSHRAAADCLAEAHTRGASQRDIADGVGKSVGWVNQLLQWRASGFVSSTPFGPASKASRQRRQTVQSPEHGTARTANRRGSPADPSLSRARAEADKAEAEAARARAEADKAQADTARAEAEAQKAKADAERAQAESRKAAEERLKQRLGRATPHNISADTRDTLVKCLGMLGSDHAGERDNAARQAEALRNKLGATWDDLIVLA